MPFPSYIVPFVLPGSQSSDLDYQQFSEGVLVPDNEKDQLKMMDLEVMSYGDH